MGSPTGFIDCCRVDDAELPLETRIKDYSDYRTPLSHEERQLQASRCMDCGVPFCQSGVLIKGKTYGCPLHNLVPEWNDDLFRGNWRDAVMRLLKTNNFPEFTGRVCPALCESACVCALNAAPVSVRANELSIIEYAFENDLMSPRTPSQRSGKRIAVVGSGPSGLAAADCLNQRGHSVVVYEKDDYLGGLLTYGIPEMKLPKAVVFRRINLMQAEGVEFMTGFELGRNIEALTLAQEYDAVVLCCGASEPRRMSFLGDQQCVSGIVYAADYLRSSTEGLLAKQPPHISAKNKNVAIVGAGDTATDCVAVALRQGCASVMQLVRRSKSDYEGLGRLFYPGTDNTYRTDYGQREAIVRFGQDPRRHGRIVHEVIANEEGALKRIITVPSESSLKGESKTKRVSQKMKETHEVELLIIASGFKGSDPKILQAFGAASSEVAGINHDDYQIPNTNVFIAGDMRKGQSLVVWAIAEGRKAARAVDTFLMGYSNMR